MQYKVKARTYTNINIRNNRPDVLVYDKKNNILKFT